MTKRNLIPITLRFGFKMRTYSLRATFLILSFDTELNWIANLLINVLV